MLRNTAEYMYPVSYTHLELLDILQKDNDSLDNIVMSIQFPDSLCNGIVNIHIYPEDYRIIDYDGTVYNENIGAGESLSFCKISSNSSYALSKQDIVSS